MTTWVYAFPHWLFGVGPCLWIVAIGIGGGLTLALAPQSRNVRLAHWFFGFAWMWAFGGLIEVILDMKLPLRIALPVAFVSAGSLGLLSVLSFVWVERNHNESVPKLGTDGNRSPALNSPSSDSLGTEPPRPMPAPRTPREQHGVPSRTSAILPSFPAFMQLDGFEPLAGTTTIAPGLPLNFVPTYTNRGMLPLHEVHMIETLAIVDEAARDETDLRAVFDKEVKDDLGHTRTSGIVGVTVGVGRSIQHPCSMTPLAEESVAGLLGGSKTLYFSTYVDWLDDNGKFGSERHYFWMERPLSNVLTKEQVWKNFVR